MICIRIGLTQARLWEMSEDALLFEMPVDFVPEETGVDIELSKATQKMIDNGHSLQPTVRGEKTGAHLHTL